MRRTLAVLAVAAVVLAVAAAAWAATSGSGSSPYPRVTGGPPPGLKSINSHPIGTVGSATEGQGGMPILSTNP